MSDFILTLSNRQTLYLLPRILLGQSDCRRQGQKSKTRRVVNRAVNAFRIAAQPLNHSQSALGTFYRRMRTRLSTAKAITAAAHKLSRIFYHLRQGGEAYIGPGIDTFERFYREHTLKKL